jgi:hypothetical protein
MKRYSWAFLIEVQPNLNAVSIMIMAIDLLKCIFLALTDGFPAPPSVIRALLQRIGFTTRRRPLPHLAAEKRIEGAGNFSNQAKKCLMRASGRAKKRPARLEFMFGI